MKSGFKALGIIILMLLLLGFCVAFLPESWRTTTVAEFLVIQTDEMKPESKKTTEKEKDNNHTREIFNVASTGGVSAVGDGRISEQDVCKPTPPPPTQKTATPIHTPIKKTILEPVVTSKPTPKSNASPMESSPTPMEKRESEMMRDIVAQTDNPDPTTTPKENGNNTFHVEFISRTKAEDLRKIGEFQRENGVMLPLLMASYSPDTILNSLSNGQGVLLIRKESGRYYRVLTHDKTRIDEATFLIATNRMLNGLSDRAISLEDHVVRFRLEPLLNAFRVQHGLTENTRLEMILKTTTSRDLLFARHQMRAVQDVKRKYALDVVDNGPVITHGILQMKGKYLVYDIDRVTIVDLEKSEKRTYPVVKP